MDRNEVPSKYTYKDFENKVDYIKKPNQMIEDMISHKKINNTIV